MRAPIALLATLAIAAGLLSAPAPAAEAALPDATTPAPVTSERIAGGNRFETSVEVSRQLRSPGDVVYLASGLGFADALAAAPVAAAEGAHLLLSRRDRLDAAVLERIVELSPSEVVIVGSAATIADSVGEKVRAAVADVAITRIGGANRVLTSLLLLDRLERTIEVERIWVVSGRNYPDALVAAASAGQQNGAIVLLHHNGTSTARSAWLAQVRPALAGRAASIAGGPPAIGWDDVLAIEQVTYVERNEAGYDRFDTARRINDSDLRWRSADSMVLATGQDFPDALAGAVLAADRGVPLYLTTGTCRAHTAAMLELEAAQHGFQHVIGLGSARSLSDASLNLQQCPTDSPVQQQLRRDFGGFPTRVYRGDGDARIDLGRDVRVMLVTAEGQQDMTFSIERLAADGRSNGMLIEHETSWSGYRGTVMTAADGLSTPTDRTLIVRHEGRWSVRVADAGSATELGRSGVARGDTVLAYGGGAATLRASVGHMGVPVSFEQIRLVGGGIETRELEAWNTGFNDMPIRLASGPSLLRWEHELDTEREAPVWELRFR